MCQLLESTLTEWGKGWSSFEICFSDGTFFADTGTRKLQTSSVKRIQDYECQLFVFQKLCLIKDGASTRCVNSARQLECCDSMHHSRCVNSAHQLGTSTRSMNKPRMYVPVRSRLRLPLQRCPSRQSQGGCGLGKVQALGQDIPTIDTVPNKSHFKKSHTCW